MNLDDVKQLLVLHTRLPEAFREVVDELYSEHEPSLIASVRGTGDTGYLVILEKWDESDQHEAPFSQELLRMGLFDALEEAREEAVLEFKARHDLEISARIIELNDRFRSTFDRSLGCVFLSRALASRPAEEQESICANVKQFQFPEEEVEDVHEYGQFDLGRHRYFFEMGYTQRKKVSDNLWLQAPVQRWEDRADAKTCFRILLIGTERELRSGKARPPA